MCAVKIEPKEGNWKFIDKFLQMFISYKTVKRT